jgi:hypothetical protein
MLVTAERVVRMAAEPTETEAVYRMPTRIATAAEVERALRRHGIAVTPPDRFEAGRRLDQLTQAHVRTYGGDIRGRVQDDLRTASSASARLRRYCGMSNDVQHWRQVVEDLEEKVEQRRRHERETVERKAGVALKAHLGDAEAQKLLQRYNCDLLARRAFLEDTEAALEEARLGLANAEKAEEQDAEFQRLHRLGDLAERRVVQAQLIEAAAVGLAKVLAEHAELVGEMAVRPGDGRHQRRCDPGATIGLVLGRHFGRYVDLPERSRDPRFGRPFEEVERERLAPFLRDDDEFEREAVGGRPEPVGAAAT